jgi:putative methanogenesis marker protein 8
MVMTAERDIHILRYFSAFISVSEGKVINVTDPQLTFCPLAGHLYKDFKKTQKGDKEPIKLVIRSAIESKIRDYGFFTAKRELLQPSVSIPYGASEMLMFALKNRAVDAAVVVCDGAGTVITNNGEVVQGIGARMNNLLLTSPIKDTIARLKKLGCLVVSDSALIDQVKGVEKAIKAGYKKIAVTVSGYDSEKLKEIRELESSTNVVVTILVVCTTGITGLKIKQIRAFADLVWSCASWDIRQQIGAVALLQISKQIPVFVLTKKGVNLFASYAADSFSLLNLNEQKQYLISDESGGHGLKLGTHNCFLREEKLPFLSEKSFVMVKS